MKKKHIIFFVTLFLVLSLAITPVSAGWFSFLKPVAKQTAEKQVIKQEEKTQTKKVESATAKQEQIQVNKATGNLLDDTFKLEWCKTRVCAKTVDDFEKLKNSKGAVYITDDWEAKKYINQNFDHFFSRRPDMISIKAKPNSNSIEEIIIFDTKTSKEAIISSEARGQKTDYDNLCSLINIRWGYACKVQYVLPEKAAKEVAKNSGSTVFGCLAIGLMMVPDPTDLLCLVTT